MNFTKRWLFHSLPVAASSVLLVLAAYSSVGVTEADAYEPQVNCFPAITGPASLPAGLAGVAYTPVTFTGSGCGTPYVWTATGLPSGMSMSTDGVLSGTPV